MPKLTVAAVQKYAPQTKRREIRDTQAPGLYLIIQPSGSKQWALRFRRPGGAHAKLSLGKVDLSAVETADDPQIGGALSLRQARELANRIDRERARGVDVVADRQAQKSRQRTAVADAAANSFGSLVREFFIDHKTRRQTRPRRWRGDARLLGLAWPPGCDPATTDPVVIKGGLADTWADKPITAIDSHDVHSAVIDARKNGIPGLPKRNRGISESRGRKMHSALSIFFTWALKQRRVTANPTTDVWHPAPPLSRDRVLTDEEIKAFWTATGDLRKPYGAAARLLLLTGARLNEVMGMRRAELSDDGVWTIPGVRTKNHRQLVLPLPALARDILPRPAGDFVFTVTGRGPVTGWSRAKAELDAAMRAAMKADIPKWRLHDLRRTCATGMQKCGIRAEVIERALNHVSGSFKGVAGTYQRDPMTEEVRTALATWAAHVEALVTGKPAKVVSMRRPARRGVT
jgi:integrase